MSLIDAFKEPCVVMNKAKVSDGEGGFTTAWQEGAEFEAAIVKDTSLEARIAEKDGLYEADPHRYPYSQAFRHGMNILAA